MKGDNWAIRKPLHKDTVSGKVELSRIKVPKDKILTATRKGINDTFDLKTIETITDTGIQKILKNYLASKDNNPALAFSHEGIEDMNKNIEKYNDGKPHKPIYKARIFETGSKFNLGQNGNKKDKFVETAKGTNLFFAIYKDENGKRNYDTIPLNIVIERQKQGLSPVPETNEKNNTLLFYLSPNDLVYVPTEEEKDNPKLVDFKKLNKEQVERIYKMEKTSGVDCYFISNCVANLIMQYNAKVKLGEFGSQNKITTTIDGKVIKECCWKLKVDRMGNITKVIM